MKNKTVTAIVVTYNRKKELVNCINHLLDQTCRLKNILIMDNCSDDGTIDSLNDKFNINIQMSHNVLQEVGQIHNTNIYVYSSDHNGGGSYGFSIAMEEAFKHLKTDLYWMMDDDGYPSNDCLEQLLAKTDNYEYIMPTSIDIKNHNKLSWPVRMKNGVKTINYLELCNSWGEIMDFVTPFNGVLLSNECLRKVGYVNKKFFIWGDEYDHYWRCKQHGISPVTLLSAKFYHPSQKLPLVKICFGLFRAPYVDSKLRMICLARNYTYIYKNYGQAYKIPLKFIQYTWLFLVTRHFDFDGWKLYILSVKDGLKGDFSRHKKYIK